MGVLSGTLGDIPFYSLKGGALLPEPPEVTARLLAARSDVGAEAIVVEPLGEWSEFVVGDWGRV